MALEWLKDLVGIIDDAKDIVDRVDDIMGDVEPIAKKLKQDGDELAKAVEEIKRSDDPDVAKRILDRLDVKRPFLLGKTMSQKLDKATNDLVDLRQRVVTLDDQLKTSGLHIVDRALDSIRKLHEKNFEAIKLISEIQEEHRDSHRKVVKIIGGAVVGAAVTTGIVGFILALSAKTIAFRALTSSLLSGTAQTASLIRDTRRSVHRMEAREPN